MPLAFSGKVFTSVVLLASVALNLLLFAEVRRLRGALKLPGRTDPLIGARIASFQARDSDSRGVTVTMPNTRPTLLYVFSPQCDFCVKNENKIAFLTQAIQDKYQILGISIGRNGLGQYLADHGVTFRVLVELDATVAKTLQIGRTTPQTLVVSPIGLVIKNWRGMYSGRTQQEIEDYFGVKFPPPT